MRRDREDDGPYERRAMDRTCVENALGALAIDRQEPLTHDRPHPDPRPHPLPRGWTVAGAGDRPPAAQPTGAGRLSGLKRYGSVLLAILAFFLFRAFTADDGTHGIQTGQCVAAVGSDDFKKVDCKDSTSLGSVTYIETNVPTEETAALASARRTAPEAPSRAPTLAAVPARSSAWPTPDRSAGTRHPDRRHDLTLGYALSP